MRADAVEPASRVVPLHTERARDPSLTGAKAANLARAAAAGLPVLPGFALVPNGRADNGADDPAVRRAWRELAGGAEKPLAVRSSSRHEDTATSSMAGRFRTVLDVCGWDAFTDAVQAVLESAAVDTGMDTAIDTGTGVAATESVHPVSPPARDAPASPYRATPPPGPPSPNGSSPQTHSTYSPEPRTPAPGMDVAAADSMAVLVQPMLRPAVGGVMFGADPVTGRQDRIVVSAVRGGPAALVDGTTQGERYHVSRAGHLLDADAVAPQEAPVLTEADLRRLAALARRAQKLFGGPQDIEFAFDTDDHLWLLQSRPITAMAPQPSRHARLLGPGPVAETFPDVLQPLEEDLWVAPMAHGLTVALDTSGSASRRMLRAVPPAVTVDGRVAADLRLLGAVPPTHRFLRLLNPIPAARQVGAAWRLGRLRATLPSLALDLMADIDRQLADYPAPDAMSGGEVLAAAGWGRRALSALHAQESLAGALLGTENDATIAGEALAALTEGRAAGDDDVTLLATRPVLLALFPPSLTQPARLPEHTSWTGVPRGVAALPVREALRLRIRWVQEMQAAMVRAYAARLTAAGLPADIDRVRLLRWHELLAVADGAPLPDDLPHRRPRPDRPELPARFRLADGVPVAEPPPRRRRRRVGGAAHPGGGQGAGGGTGTGTVWDGHGARPDHAVLVVRVLDPGLAPVLPGLAGLVAETGSPLSHLAVLAREQRVPTATAVPDAVTRFPVGTRVTVDGGTGEVEAHPDGTDDGLPGPPRADEGGPSAAPGTTPLHEADTRNVPRADVSWRSDRAERAVPDDASKGGSPC